MKYWQLKKMCEESLYGFALTITEYVLDCLDEDADIDESDFEDYVNEQLDSYFTYYVDAWEYLQDNNITDFSEAINEWGCTDVCGIACYYASEEVTSDVFSEWDYYDTLPEEDEEDADIDLRD